MSGLRSPVAQDLLDTLKVSRPGFWSTSVWFYLLPVGQRDMFGSWPFWVGLVYVAFPLGLLLYGWNDLFDAATDRRNPRKDSLLFGARPDAAQRARLPWRIALVQLPFVAVFTWLLGPAAWLWFAAVVACTAVYNVPPLAWKNRPFLDLLAQTGYLLVFVLSSWINGVPQLPAGTLVFGALFAMHSHLFGQVMDHEPDLAAGRTTTAGLLGVVPAKLLIVALLASEAGLAWWSLGDAVIAAFLLASAAWFALDALWLFGARTYSLSHMRAFLLGWNAIAFGSMHWVWARGSFVG